MGFAPEKAVAVAESLFRGPKSSPRKSMLHGRALLLNQAFRWVLRLHVRSPVMISVSVCFKQNITCSQTERVVVMLALSHFPLSCIIQGGFAHEQPFCG
jgi:hypothetical protein